MLIKTSELTGTALDWAVAHIDGYKLTTDGITKLLEKGDELLILGPHNSYLHYSPSTDWAQGGPIIEREKIDSYYSTSTRLWAAAIWKDLSGGGQLEHKQTACPTALIAAMRCYVASKLGDEVEVPEELI